MPIPKLSNRQLGPLLALAALAAGMLGYGLGCLPLIGPDEPRYAEVAREMYLTGDWVTTRLGGIHWFEKPALLYWMVAVSYELWGVSELATRAGAALLAAAGALLLFLFGRGLRSARYGYLSAAALLTSALWVGFGRGATFDIVLAVTTELALLAFFRWEGGGARRAWWVCGGALGLAVLAKGLVGVVLPGAIAGAYLVITGGLGRALRRRRELLLGALVFVATAGVWYGPVIWRHGGGFIREFFVAHHFERYLTNKYRHPQPVYFFFVVALAGIFPWSAYLVAAAARAAREWRTLVADPAQRLRLFLWLWALVPILFFSFSGSKLPGYILPSFPALALLIGEELERWWTEAPSRGRVALGMATSLLLMAAAAATGWRVGGDLGAAPRASWAVAGVAGAVALGHLVLLFARGGRAATLALPPGLFLVVVAAAHWLFPGLGTRESMRDLSFAAARQARPGERLAFYISQEQSINFYATGLPLRDARSDLVTAMKPEEVEELLAGQEAGSLLVIARKRWSPDLHVDPRLAVETLAEQPRHARCSPRCDLELLRVRRR